MNDDESNCMQMATIAKDDKSGDQCTTLLNGDYYSKLLQTYIGIGGTASGVKKIDPTKDL